ncbi:hypothetical protein E3J59_02745 [Candidatus Aerophobetes bacterium]|uniref:Uncharacterized protein n=1 Tax=Aerophobetes bacterium TaxID=2030807 RepID=A0A523UW68_UNCAE|nr:MAG: hypothetical protein E3J59_02745 [Candidatus Aerophobetes bacterium]
MANSFPNRPKLLRGAFVEYGLSIPPLIVTFQFNPVSISRSRSNTFSAPGSEEGTLRQFHQRYSDLTEIRDLQQVSVEPETITNLEVRFDATDKLNEGNFITEQFGISPQLATLELMMHPKGESLLGAALSSLLGSSGGFSFTGGEKPPMILFIWGRKKVLPVNITSMSINEEEFTPELNPIRATVSVDLTVIEGKNIPYLYSKAMKEAMSVLNLANLPDIASTIVPI